VARAECATRDARPQLSSNVFVSIPVTDFQKAYAAVLHVLSGNLKFAPGALRVNSVGHGGQRQTLADTLADRALYMGGLLFVDPAERASFFWRVGNVLPLVEEKKYRKYRGEDAFALHVALLRAICAVRGDARMTKKALRAAFDAEFRLQLANTVSSDAHLVQ
jgi:hypothetical protein